MTMGSMPMAATPAITPEHGGEAGATDRRTATTVGVLFLVATAAYLVGSALVAAAVQAPTTPTSLNERQLRLGILLELVNAAAVVGIGVLLFPALRRHGEGMALGYAGARLIEAVLLVVGALGVLLLPALGRGLLGADAAAPAQLGGWVDVAMAWHELTFQAAMIALGAGSLLLCAVLYTHRLVPRVLSVVGAAGYIALLASGCLALAGRESSPLLYAPGAIFEVGFPLWLIVKGFREPAPAAPPGR